MGRPITKGETRGAMNQSTTQEEAKFFRDKHVLETIKLEPNNQDKITAIIGLGVKPENFDKIIGNPSINEQVNVKLKFLELTSGRDKDWPRATELLRDYVMEKLRIYTTKDDLKSETWVYKDGVYVPNGKSEVKKLLRNLLGQNYSTYIYGRVIEKIEPDTFIDADKFFTQENPELVPVLNGILNVKTGELHEFDEDLIFFNKIPVNFDPLAKCPKIEKFLKDVLANEDDIKVVEEVAGYSLLREAMFEKAFMLVGSGRNGKGKTIDLLRRLVGIENCSALHLSALTTDNFSISELFGKSLNIAGDVGNNDLKETNMFKLLTGRDMVTAKRKFKQDLHFHNYAKFVFACNDLPMVYDLSKGFWDRWILLEFPYYFADQGEFDKMPVEKRKNWKIKDEEIINKISTPEEMSGFLNKALLGLQRLLIERHFSFTKGSEQVKDTWIRKSNSFIAFCYENLETKSDGKISKKDLRQKYAEYCKLHNIASKSDFVIKKVLQDIYGVIEDRISIGSEWGEWYWIGIKFK